MFFCKDADRHIIDSIFLSLVILSDAFQISLESSFKPYSHRYVGSKKMVELQVSPYDSDFIPFAEASIVTFDDELSPESVAVPAAESLSSASPMSSGSAPVWEVLNEPNAATTRPLSSLPPPQQQERQQQQKQQETAVPKAAAAGGAVVGLFLGGPIVSLILGIGAHHYAKREGATGDCARALGEIALVTRDKFRRVNDRHHLVDKGKKAASRTLHNMQRADRKHKAKERFGYFVSHCYALTLDFVYRHRLIERGSEKFKKLLNMVTKAIRDRQNQVSDRAQNEDGHRKEPRNDMPPSSVY
jgi:hypothetical protein